MISLAEARAQWFHRQGLAAPRAATVAGTIEACGWPRTLGGIEAYLAIRARLPGVCVADVHAAIEAREISVVPAVRGCMYVVPRSHAPLCVAFAEEQARGRLEGELAKCEVSPAELRGVCDAVVGVLSGTAATTDQLRKLLPAGVVRSLGELGKKVGISSTLPPALRILEFGHRIERRPLDHRLDHERYAWGLRAGEIPSFPSSSADRHAALASIFLAQFAPATLASFAEWSGLSKRDGKAAIERVGATPVEVEGIGAAFTVEGAGDTGPSSAIRFLPFDDGYLLTPGGPRWFTPESSWDLVVPSWGAKAPMTIGTVKHLALRVVLDGPTALGLWEWDAAAGEIVVDPFAAVPRARRGALDEARASLGAFIGNELGHARSFSLDSDAQVQARAERLRGGL